ncbi:MAG: hypothetical protein ACLFSB_16470, partial [Chitinispirillaceae bacterium]
MKISGFSFARNAQKLYYPVAEAIKSILPICDEFVIAIGQGDEDDFTRKAVEDIGDPKVKIIDTVWHDQEKLRGNIYGQQTNIALNECSGDWCFYIQAEEVVHEKYLPVMKSRCEQLLDDRRVQGLLFNYKHFWGDYTHFHVNHAWYPREIRIVRNGLGIESWQSAQSFRLHEEKISVATVDAEIFHYGWVRPPKLRYSKQKEFGTTHRGKKWAEEHYRGKTSGFHYGSLERLHRYTDAQPAVMNEWIKKFDWADQLQYTGKSIVQHKHDRFKYRL